MLDSLQQESTRCDPQYKISIGMKFNDNSKSVACRTISLPSPYGFCSKFRDSSPYVHDIN